MSILSPPSGFRESLLAILQASRRRSRMDATFKTTRQSLVYRRKAAEFARLAEAERDEIKMLPLVHQALSWIQLAENEEFLDMPGHLGAC